MVNNEQARIRLTNNQLKHLESERKKKTGTTLKLQSWKLKKQWFNDHLCVSKVSWKFSTPSIYTFAVICPWNLLRS